MGFWEDSSPIVKVALIVGVLAVVYVGIAFAMGLPPFPAKCSHEVDGATVSGCPEGTECSEDGECVTRERGITR